MTGTSDPTAFIAMLPPVGRENRTEDLAPRQDYVLTHLQRLYSAQEAIGERHISMMKWSAEKYAFEKQKRQLMISRVQEEGNMF